MAGSNPGFDADAFRSGVRLAMTMGAAPKPDERVTFHFARTTDTTANVDADGVPFAAGAQVTYTAPDPIQVDCAVEYTDATGQPSNALGVIQPTRVTLTLLDEEYELVKEAVEVEIDGDIYVHRRTEPPSGLFTVGLYRMHFHAESET